MSRAPLLAATVALGLLTAGCGGGLVPFTHEIRTGHGLTDKDVKNLQFYVSRKITLRRELESGSKQITGNHKLLLVSGKTIEEVVVEELTPGIAVAVTEDAISISFEQGSSLTFSAAPEAGTPAPLAFAEPPDPFPGSTRRAPEPFPGLTARSAAGGNYWLSVESGGRVPYHRTLFAAIDESITAHLLIDAESLDEVVEERKVLPGLRLPGR